jgi:hypothetical protein
LKKNKNKPIGETIVETLRPQRKSQNKKQNKNKKNRNKKKEPRMLKSLHDKFRKQQNASKKDMLKNSNKNDSLNLSLNDCMCPICLEIFIEPVRMPCKHEICLNCFETMLDKTNLCCPMCRLRISTWARQATNNNTLVDIKRWQSIQNRFPDEIDKRLTGKSREDVENTLGKTVQASKQDIHFAHDGEIRKEFLEFMKRVCACNYLYTA